MLPIFKQLSLAGIALSWIAALSGCTTTTGNRDQANGLVVKLSEYRAEQSNRVENVNRAYREAFTRLMNTFSDLTKTELEQGRDGDAQNLTDVIIYDKKATLVGVLRGNFAQTMANQRKAIANADDAVTAAGAAYASAYTEAKLELSKLDTVMADLTFLATREKPSDIFNNATHVIKVMIDAHDELSKQAKEAAGKKAAPKK